MTHETTKMRESIQVHKELGVFKIKFFEGAWEDPCRREAIQMLEVWQEILNIKLLDDTWHHTGEGTLDMF